MSIEEIKDKAMELIDTLSTDLSTNSYRELLEDIDSEIEIRLDALENEA